MLPNFPDFVRGETISQLILDKIAVGFSSIVKGLEGANSSLPSWVQNLGLALLSILIPLAIAILTELIQQKRTKASFYELDLQVILDHVFKIKPLIVFSALIFLPFFFWENTNGLARFFELLVSGVGIIFVAKTIMDVYFWTRGNVFAYRLSYLKKLNNLSDLEIAFRSAWSSKDINPQKERELFNIFFSKIDRILNRYEARP
jgi:hypothetical protein